MSAVLILSENQSKLCHALIHKVRLSHAFANLVRGTQVRRRDIQPYLGACLLKVSALCEVSTALAGRQSREPITPRLRRGSPRIQTS
jgi:hypothetical protein